MNIDLYKLVLYTLIKKHKFIDSLWLILERKSLSFSGICQCDRNIDLAIKVPCIEIF